MNQLVTGLTSHVVERYPAPESTPWMFEVWYVVYSDTIRVVLPNDVESAPLHCGAGTSQTCATRSGPLTSASSGQVGSGCAAPRVVCGRWWSHKSCLQARRPSILRCTATQPKLSSLLAPRAKLGGLRYVWACRWCVRRFEACHTAGRGGDAVVLCPQTAGGAWLAAFLNFTRATSAPVDFVSTHGYPNQVSRRTCVTGSSTAPVKFRT